MDHFIHCSTTELLNDNPKWVKSFRRSRVNPDAYIGHPTNSQEGQKAKKTVMLNHIPFLMLVTVDSGAFNLGTQQPLAPYLLNSIRKLLITDVRAASKQLFTYVDETGNSDFRKFFDRPKAVEDLATLDNVNIEDMAGLKSQLLHECLVIVRNHLSLLSQFAQVQLLRFIEAVAGIDREFTPNYLMQLSSFRSTQKRLFSQTRLSQQVYEVDSAHSGTAADSLLVDAGLSY